ncbi:hypothetical protein TRIATDRAFT_92533 [Trichoderma atroviride IMI 206040]|uniref:Uncharacterized protein n=1 Tax=Hypocrea atroviridis (strain ATCC 20476 / IMI 206040) TaxID=452589 RepID=G9NI71_HYPAI|nr:uncharacterized protein TRIATDRAFT_92533 [Trichoderma atroviride IMI 206040]EHK49484.1 hypothetical protein TRIATDRAFT_92533 [Trichoderma atroviride IMI 206040]
MNKKGRLFTGNALERLESKKKGKERDGREMMSEKLVEPMEMRSRARRLRDRRALEGGRFSEGYGGVTWRASTGQTLIYWHLKRSLADRRGCGFYFNVMTEQVLFKASSDYFRLIIGFKGIVSHRVDPRLPAAVLCLLPVFSAVSGYLPAKSPQRTPQRRGAHSCHVPDAWSGHHFWLLAASDWLVSPPPATLIGDLSLVSCLLHIHGCLGLAAAISGMDLESRRQEQRRRKARRGEARQDSKTSSRLEPPVTRRFTIFPNHTFTSQSSPPSSPSPPATSPATSNRPSQPLRTSIGRFSAQSGLILQPKRTAKPIRPIARLGLNSSFFSLAGHFAGLLCIPARGRQAAKKGSLSLQRVRHCTWLARGGLKLGRGQCLRTGQAMIHTEDGLERCQGPHAWSGERRGRATMGGCRFGHGRDDDDGRGDDDGHGRLWATNMADAGQSACRQHSDTVRVHEYDLTFCGRRPCKHCVLCGRGERVRHIGIDSVTLIPHVSLHKQPDWRNAIKPLCACS